MLIMESSHERLYRKRVSRWIPVLYITLGACCVYYAYVFELCIATVTSLTERVIYLVFFNLLFIMSLVSYWTTVCTRPAKPPKAFYLSETDKELYKTQNTQKEKHRILREAAKDLPISTTSEVTFCETCQVLKPSRCHHCSSCDVCVLKMDHHCFLLNNCVGYANHKSYLLLLMYTLLLFMFVFGTSIRYVILTLNDDTSVRKITLDILCAVSITISVTLLMYFIFHCYLLVRNTTTLELVLKDASSGRDGHPLGFKNFKEVFGHEKRYWLLPVHTSLGDGYSLPPLPDDPEKYAE